MVEVYTIFSLAKDDVKLENGRLYFFPLLDGTFGGFGQVSALTPILFVKDDK